MYKERETAASGQRKEKNNEIGYKTDICTYAGMVEKEGGILAG
jgi:hypothetical protein